MEIRKYEDKYWLDIEKIHDSSRRIELEFAKLEKAFIPLQEAAKNEGLFDYEVYLGFLDNKVVGFIAYDEDEIAWLYVAEEYMNRGVGKNLIKYSLDKIKKKPVKLEVLSGNIPAQKLYESLGFKVVEQVSGRMPGNESFEVFVNCMELK